MVPHLRCSAIMVLCIIKIKYMCHKLGRPLVADASPEMRARHGAPYTNPVTGATARALSVINTEDGSLMNRYLAFTNTRS